MSTVSWLKLQFVQRQLNIWSWLFCLTWQSPAVRKEKKYYTRCIQQTMFVFVPESRLAFWCFERAETVRQGCHCIQCMLPLQKSEPVLFIIHYECCRYHNHSYLHNSFESQQGIAVFHQELNIEQFWVA